MMTRDERNERKLTDAVPSWWTPRRVAHGLDHHELRRATDANRLGTHEVVGERRAIAHDELPSILDPREHRQHSRARREHGLLPLEPLQRAHEHNFRMQTVADRACVLPFPS